MQEKGRPGEGRAPDQISPALSVSASFPTLRFLSLPPLPVRLVSRDTQGVGKDRSPISRRTYRLSRGPPTPMESWRRRTLLKVIVLGDSGSARLIHLRLTFSPFRFSSICSRLRFASLTSSSSASHGSVSSCGLASAGSARRR